MSAGVPISSVLGSSPVKQIGLFAAFKSISAAPLLNVLVLDQMLKPTTMKRTMVGAMALVLLSGIALVAYGELRPLPKPTFTGDLASVLPTAEEVPGWQIKREEIADTPEMKRAVDELLNFDDAVFSSFMRGSERISIYIAYWRPGKMPHRMIAGHTPDRCWVKVGWERAGARVANGLKGPGGNAVAAAEQREMRRQSASEWVLFWHLVGGEPLSYGSAKPPWHAGIGDAISRGLNQRDEQFFIRVSADRPVAEWWESSMIQLLIEKLRQRKVPI